MNKERRKEHQEYISRASETFGKLMAPIQQRGAWASRDEAEQICNFAMTTIRELQQIKRETNQEMKDIRLSFDARSPQKGGLFKAAVTRRDLDLQKRKALQPYEQLLTGLDSMITSLEGAKVGAKQGMDAFG
jgi:hypothetical protein